jgi:hypothetical protein
MRHPSEGWRINGQYDETNDPTEAAAGLSGGNRERQSLLFRLHVGFQGLLWIISGGLAYTSGVAFYLAKRLAYSHLIWHLFVSAGTACHFCAVLWYAG